MKNRTSSLSLVSSFRARAGRPTAVTALLALALVVTAAPRAAVARQDDTVNNMQEIDPTQPDAPAATIEAVTTVITPAEPAAAPTPAPAPVIETPPPPARATVADGPAYEISRFELDYVRENPEHPPLEDVMLMFITLGRTSDGWVAPRADVPLVPVRLAELSTTMEQTYYASAIQRILESIRDHFNRQSLIGIFVAPDPSQITEIGVDERDGDETELRILITTGIITELRTLASGDRIPNEDRINHPLHDRIRENSPLKPYWGLQEEQSDLMRKDQLDRYIYHLSRHPGRRVDVAVSAAVDSGGTAMDYLVTENNPLVLYAETSNTGTASTSYWRHRVGLLHTQLTNSDDVLEVSYSTTDFESNHGLSSSYERPFPDNDRLRWRLSGSWSEFTADDVGFFDDDFTGESWSLGAQVIANIYQDKEYFVDLFGGVRYYNNEVNNPLIGRGEEDFIIPFVGLRFDKSTERSSTVGSVRVEWSDGGWTGVDEGDLNRLGRTLPDEDWVVLRGAMRHSFYLEPLLDSQAWEDATTPESSTLAHEISLSASGQYAFDNRLIPNLERALGGMYSVRGYPQSVVAGDNAFMGSIEYRYHVPRALDVQAEPGRLFGEPFRIAPQYVYGIPDWDLILKGFFDVGYVSASDELSFEESESLMGTGVGVELHFRRNIRLRLDWGFVLDEISDRNVNSGSNRAHFAATIVF